MKKINIDFNKEKLGTVAREGEYNRTELVFSLDEDLRDCDFINVVFGINDNLEDDENPTIENLQPDEGGTTLTIKLNQDITVRGMLYMQLVGYVVDSVTAEPQVIAKSPVVSGVVTPSLKGKKKVSDSSPSLLDRIWAKIQAWSDKIHTHSNKDILDLITAENLSGGKTVIKNTAIRFSGSLSSDKYYIFVNPAERIAVLDLVVVSGFDTLPEFVFEFTSGHGGFPTRLSLPRGIKWANDDVPEIKVGYRYIIRIFDNVASYAEVEI